MDLAPFLAELTKRIDPFRATLVAMKLIRGPSEIRFRAKYKVVAVSGCWQWAAGLKDDGYAQFNDETLKTVTAHKWSYEHFVGAVPHGKEIHHRCENRACVNPEHMVCLTRAEHLAVHLKPTCPRGHSNEFQVRRGKRECRRCHREDMRERRAREVVKA